MPNTLFTYRKKSAPSYQGLFDLYPDDWAAGYSFRLLDNDWSGGITYQRAWDGSSNQGKAIILPRLIGSEYWLDLDSKLEDLDSVALARGLTTSDTLADLVDADGAAYSSFAEDWKDQTGSGKHATQSTESAQPMLVNAGSLVTENGKAALRFDGVNDYLEASGFGTGNTRSIFGLVTRKGSLNSYHNIWIFSASFSGFLGDFMQMYSNDGTDKLIQNFVTSGLDETESGTSFTLDDQVLIAQLKSSTEVEFRINGSIESINSGAQDLEDGLFIGTINTSGSNRSANMTAQEIIVSSVDKTPEVSGIESNINSAFSIW